MNIAFVANGDKCQFFDLIGRSMGKKIDLKVYWICVGKSQHDYLLSIGYDANDILLLNWDVKESSGTKVGEYKLNELAYVDRVLKYHFEDGITFLTKLQSLFYDFVKSKNLSYIFGEMTLAHEILMNRICRDKFADTCFYLHPQSIRIPNGRFTFMDTEFQGTIFPAAEYIHDQTETDNFEIPIKPVVPQRVADVARDVKKSLSLQYRVNRISKFVVNRFKSHPKDNLQTTRRNSLSKRIDKFLTIEHNKYYYTKLLKKSTLADLEGKKFFFITLHMQPEASIDVVGRYYEDQFLLIWNVWRILPTDYSW